MIGRFLELGLQCDQVLDSIGFFEELRFRQLNVGDIWQHPYAVLSDGDINIGLHGTALPGPMVTFVQPDLADELIEYRSRGVEFLTVVTGDDRFNELVFTDPDGNPVRILEARTFSPPHFDPVPSTCGRFREISLPSRDLDHSVAFWERMGFEELGRSSDPHPHAWLRGNGVVLGLHQGAINRPALSFQSENLSTRLATLRQIGIDTTSEGPAGVAGLKSPDGLPIFLHGV